MQDQFLHNFATFIREHHLIAAGEQIGVAVSGGVDSVTLLDLLLRAKQEIGAHYVVLHFNHQLRAESAAEEDFVRKLCDHAGIPFVCDRADVGAFADDQKLSIEMAARELRYRFFARCQKDHALHKIATGHTASDQAETILDRILRGTGIEGLAGIPTKRELYIRPLLFAQRHEIEQYAAQRGLKYMTDASNTDYSFKRNRIRHQLLPLLAKEFNPQIHRNLARLGQHARQASLLLDQMAEQAFEDCLLSRSEEKIVLEFDRFLTYLNLLQRLVLRRSFSTLGQNPELLTYNRFRNIEQFLHKKGSGRLQFSTELTLIKSDDNLIIEKPTLKKRRVTLKTVPGRYFLWDNFILEIKDIEKPLTFANQNPCVEFVDADVLQRMLIVRTPEPGDQFYPINGRGRQKLKKFFIDQKVPIFRRERTPVLLSGDKIVWICGHRLDDRFKITEKTRNIYQIKLIERDRENIIRESRIR